LYKDHKEVIQRKLKIMKRFQYSENNKEAGTKAVFLTEAGYSIRGKICLYIDGSEDMVYMSNTTIQIGLKTGLLKSLN